MNRGRSFFVPAAFWTWSTDQAKNRPHGQSLDRGNRVYWTQKRRARLSDPSNSRFSIAVTHLTFVVATLVASIAQTAKVATTNSITGIADPIHSSAVPSPARRVTI